jgi:ankyrin repeat protein
MLYPHLANLSQPQLNSHFDNACSRGELDVIRYMLTSSELRFKADIHYELDVGFRNACYEGHLDIVKYLLTSPELNKHADIHAKYDQGYMWACIKNHVSIVKFLLTSPDLADHINYKNDYAFKAAFDKKSTDVLNFLLYEMQYTPENYNLYDDPAKIESAKAMFIKRDLFLNLDSTLEKKIVDKVHKI